MFVLPDYTGEMERGKDTADADGVLKAGVLETTSVDEQKAKQLRENLAKYEQLFGAGEDAFEQPTTTRKELWSYYLYYNACTFPHLQANTDLGPGRQRSRTRLIFPSPLPECLDERRLGPGHLSHQKGQLQQCWLCYSMGLTNSISHECSPHRKWDLLRGHDGYVRWPWLRSGLWELRAMAAAGFDCHMLGISVLYDGYKKTGSMACCDGVLHHCLYRICECPGVVCYQN